MKQANTSEDKAGDTDADAAATGPGRRGPAQGRRARDGAGRRPDHLKAVGGAPAAAPADSPSGSPGARDEAPRADPAADPGLAPGRPGGKRAGGRKKAGKRAAADKAAESPPEVIEIAPLAQPARMRRRHWGVVLSFVLFVLAPLAAAGWYLWGVATDQYATTVGFTVRQQEGGAASDLLGGIAQFAGGGDRSDSDILYEFIESQDMVVRVNEELDLVAIFSRPWPGDPVFALSPDATIEDLVAFWQRMIRVAYDQNTGLIELQVLTFDPEESRAIGREILANSQDLINDLNATARADTILYAQADLDEALARLKTAREALTTFRTRTQIVDPESDLQGRMGVLNNLQQQYAQALIDYDLLGDAGSGDPRQIQAQRRIDVIRDRIAEERARMSTPEASVVGEDYPSLLAEYESLVVDRQYAEESYRAALAALDAARTEASRQNRYLATYIQPTAAERAAYPQRGMLFGLAALFLVMLWSVLALVYYSIRDRR